LVTLPGSCTDYFIFNTTQPPFDNLAVRQAFAQALDRADYVETQAHGLAQPAQSLIPPDHPGYAPRVVTKYIQSVGGTGSINSAWAVPRANQYRINHKINPALPPGPGRVGGRARPNAG
jgi:ABC-type transport system substrate-binding protein